jgi:chromosome partitioning protein
LPKGAWWIIPGLEQPHELIVLTPVPWTRQRGRGEGWRSGVNGGVQEVALTRIVAIANQKGGVGKTTTAVNLAASLAMSGSRVLLVDLDPQGNATMGSGVDKSDLESSIYDWLIESMPLESVVRRCQGGYELLPGNTDLTAAELDLLRQERREFRMRDRLSSEVRSRYDYVIIDCPPRSTS